jgi:hypothetical protein
VWVGYFVILSGLQTIAMVYLARREFNQLQTKHHGT